MNYIPSPPVDPFVNTLAERTRCILAKQDALFEEYAAFKGISIIELLKDTTAVKKQGSLQSTFFYKGEPFLLLSEPVMIHTDAFVKLTASFKRLWRSDDEEPQKS